LSALIVHLLIPNFPTSSTVHSAQGLPYRLGTCTKAESEYYALDQHPLHLARYCPVSDLKANLSPTF